MVRRNGPVTPMPPKDFCPTPPAPPIVPLVSVKSVNGQTGDVVLKELTIGEKTYNGSEDVSIYASDLGLARAFVYKGSVSTKEQVLEYLDTAEAGDVFYCREDKLFYLSLGEGNSLEFVSIDALNGYATKSWVENQHYVTDAALNDYSLIRETGNYINLTVDTDTYKVTVELYNKDNVLLSTDYIDLPIEGLVRYGHYDPSNKCVVLEMMDGGVVNIPLSDLVDGLASQAEVDAIKAVIPADASPEDKLVTKSYVDAETGTITHILVNGDEQPIVDKTVDVPVPTTTSELTNDSDFITHDDLEVGEQLVAKYSIGGISKGDVYAADTPMQDLLSDLLTKVVPETTTTVFWGTSTTVPVDVTGLDSDEVPDSDIRTLFVEKTFEDDEHTHYLVFAYAKEDMYEEDYGPLQHIYYGNIVLIDWLQFWDTKEILVDIGGKMEQYHLYWTVDQVAAGTDICRFVWN